MKVYKYRKIDDQDIFERDIETFSKNSFFAPTLETFDDELEANFKEQISFLSKSLKDNLVEVTAHKNKIGVYCLAKTYDNKHLWENYAGDNQGYCIEYDIEKLTDRSKNLDYADKIEILYDNRTPVLGIQDIINRNLIPKMFGIKRVKYRPEQEIRLIFDSASLKVHHESAITAIYFGTNSNEELHQKFITKFADRDINFFKMIITQNGIVPKLIKEHKRKLTYNLNKYNFKVIKHNIFEHVESFHVYLSGENDTESLKDFALAFKEKNSHKLCLIHIYNNLEISNLIDIHPLPDNEYIKFANSYIAVADFCCDEFLDEFPYKDFKYKQLASR